MKLTMMMKRNWSKEEEFRRKSIHRWEASRAYTLSQSGALPRFQGTTRLKDVIDRAIGIPDVTRSGMKFGENPDMAEIPWMEYVIMRELAESCKSIEWVVDIGKWEVSVEREGESLQFTWWRSLDTITKSLVIIGIIIVVIHSRKS